MTRSYNENDINLIRSYIFEDGGVWKINWKQDKWRQTKDDIAEMYIE